MSPAPLQKAQSILVSLMKDLFIVESSKEYSEVMVEEAWERLKNSIVYYRGRSATVLVNPLCLKVGDGFLV